MPSRITCTPGGVADNSYVSLAQATAYFDNDLRGDDWTDISEDTRERALILATRDIEGLGGGKRSVNSSARTLFPGTPYLSLISPGVVQALHFPTWDDWVYTNLLAIPSDIQAAVCEQALWLIQQREAPPLVDHEGLRAAGVAATSIDGLSITYGPTACPPGIAPKAWAAIGSYIATAFGTC